MFLSERSFKMKNRNNLLKMIFAALFLSLAYVMPFLTGQIPKLGSMLCPMHVPILLCGFICGWQWGLVLGLIAPLMRSLTLGMPPLFPVAVCMAAELAAYGAFSGLMHKVLPKKKPYIYCSLLAAMAAGRLIWGAAMFVCVGIKGGSFTLTAFLSGAVINAVPGIIVQIVLVPILVMLLERVTASQKEQGKPL
ncbi:MAG: ECF transporter S component [Clostridia bacterium]|nr:ECF transporter S component [Clostridia bacterium]